MVSNLTLIGCFCTLFVSLLLPVILILLFCNKHKGQKLFSAWVLGAAGFFVTQIVIRVPILTMLQSQPGFAGFAEDHMFLYAFGLAFTAGLFELVGRFAVAKLMEKNLSYHRSLAAGLGHGGIEAVLIVGITYLNNLLYIFMINSGTFDAMVAQAAQTGVDVSALLLVKESLISTSPVLFFLGGFERILTMIVHTAMTLLVCYGVHTGKALKYSLLCLGLHTFIDLTAGISLLTEKGLSQGTVYCIIYAILTAVAAVSLISIRNIRRRWQESEGNYV